MAHNMTPRRALRLVHFTRAALALTDAGTGQTWEQLAADAEQWALASLAGDRTRVVVREANGSAHLTLTSYGACVLARQTRVFCGFVA